MIISYQRRWGNDGTCYRQTIKIDKWLMEEFNNYLKELKDIVEEDYKKNRCYSYVGLSIKSLDYIYGGVNYTNLIHLNIFNQLIHILNNKGYNLDNRRILNRNTILEVI